MQGKPWISGLIILVLAAGWAAACGQTGGDDDTNPDQDDDATDDDDTDDDDTDDDDTEWGSPNDDLLTFCIHYLMECLDLNHEGAGDYCRFCLDEENDCSTGALLRLFECTGRDCGKWDECKGIWDQEITCK